MSFSDVMCFYENSDWEENVQRRIAGLPLRQRQRDRRSLAHRLYELEKAKRAREAALRQRAREAASRRRARKAALRQRQRARRAPSLDNQIEKAKRAREAAERIAKQIETDRLEAERLHAEEIKEQQERRVKEKPSNECVVCLDRIPCQVLVPCGHVFCETCCSQFQLCPIDRIPVQQHIRLKFA